jgi:hypothetical protein
LERLTRGHVVAAVAALALLLVMAMNWYGSQEADLAHKIASGSQNSGTQAGEATRELKEDADAVIARDEKNPWQETDRLDRVLLVFLLLSVFLPLFAAGYRAASSRPRPRLLPTFLAALAAMVAAGLLVYRIIDKPGNDASTTLKIGAPIGLALLGVIGIASAYALTSDANAEEHPTTDSDQPVADQPDPPAAEDAPATG